MSKTDNKDETAGCYLSHESWDAIYTTIQIYHPELADARIAEKLEKKNISITVFLS
jgi:hypothetical protein